MTVDGIDPKMLRLASALSFISYTGLILILPPVLAAKYWETVTRISAEVIGGACTAWAEETADTLHLLKDVTTA